MKHLYTAILFCCWSATFAQIDNLIWADENNGVFEYNFETATNQLLRPSDFGPILSFQVNRQTQKVVAINTDDFIDVFGQFFFNYRIAMMDYDGGHYQVLFELTASRSLPQRIGDMVIDEQHNKLYFTLNTFETPFGTPQFSGTTLISIDLSTLTQTEIWSFRDDTDFIENLAYDPTHDLIYYNVLRTDEEGVVKVFHIEENTKTTVASDFLVFTDDLTRFEYVAVNDRIYLSTDENRLYRLDPQGNSELLLESSFDGREAFAIDEENEALYIFDDETTLFRGSLDATGFVASDDFYQRNFNSIYTPGRDTVLYELGGDIGISDVDVLPSVETPRYYITETLHSPRELAYHPSGGQIFLVSGTTFNTRKLYSMHLDGGNLREAFDLAEQDVISWHERFSANQIVFLDHESLYRAPLSNLTDTTFIATSSGFTHFDVGPNNIRVDALNGLAEFEYDFQNEVSYYLIDGDEVFRENESILAFDVNDARDLTLIDTDQKLYWANTSGAKGLYEYDITSANVSRLFDFEVTSFAFKIQSTVPVFTSQSFSVDENAAQGTIIGTLSASDPNGEALTFSILSGNENDAFALSTTGELSVENSDQLDFEVNPEFVLVVQVANVSGITAQANITIQLNDLEENEAPIVEDQSFSVQENSPNGTLIGSVVASDPEGGPLTFHITSGNDQDAFALNETTGELSVSNQLALDFETTPDFDLIIAVSDSELTTDATITITITDVDEIVLSSQQTTKKIRVYPNPASDVLLIDWPLFAEASLFDLAGQELVRSSSNKLELRTLTRGLYMLHLKGMDGHTIVQKISIR